MDCNLYRDAQCLSMEWAVKSHVMSQCVASSLTELLKTRSIVALSLKKHLYIGTRNENCVGQCHSYGRMTVQLWVREITGSKRPIFGSSRRRRRATHRGRDQVLNML